MIKQKIKLDRSRVGTLLFSLLGFVFCPSAHANERIVSLAPSVTETLFSIGAGKEVVGVTRYCKHPKEAQSLPKLGGISDLNLESLLSLKPSLVITLGKSNTINKKLENLKVKSISVSNESIEEIYRSIRDIGRATNHQQEASKLEADIKERFKHLKANSASRRKVRALIIVGRTKHNEKSAIFVAGANTIFNDLLSHIGARNVVEQINGYPQLSFESLLLSDPEIVFDISSETPPDKSWLRKLLPNSTVLYLEQDFMYSPGPRIGQTAQALNDAIEKHLKDIERANHN